MASSKDIKMIKVLCKEKKPDRKSRSSRGLIEVGYLPPVKLLSTRPLVFEGHFLLTLYGYQGN